MNLLSGILCLSLTLGSSGCKQALPQWSLNGQSLSEQSQLDLNTRGEIVLQDAQGQLLPFEVSLIRYGTSRFEAFEGKVFQRLNLLPVLAVAGPADQIRLRAAAPYEHLNISLRLKESHQYVYPSSAEFLPLSEGQIMVLNLYLEGNRLDITGLKPGMSGEIRLKRSDYAQGTGHIPYRVFLQRGAQWQQLSGGKDLNWTHQPTSAGVFTTLKAETLLPWLQGGDQIIFMPVDPKARFGFPPGGFSIAVKP